MTDPVWLDEEIDSGPKTREDVQAELHDVRGRTGVDVVMWVQTPYNYPALFNELPKVEAVIQQVVAREPALKDEKIIFKVGQGRTGVVRSTINVRFIAIDYTDPPEVIRTTIEEALKPLKLRKNTEKRLSELAQRCKVGGIGLWSDKDYDYENIDRAIPNIQAAIEALPPQTRKALERQNVVVKEELGQVGLMYNSAYQRKISIDHQAPPVAIGQVIEATSRRIAERSDIERKLSGIANFRGICPITLWGNKEYPYAELQGQVDKIGEAIGALSDADKRELWPRSGVRIVLTAEGGNTGLIINEGSKLIVIDAVVGTDEIKKVIEDALTELNKETRFREGLDRLEQKIGKPISRSDALARAGIFPDLSKIEAAFDDLLYHGVTFDHAERFSIVGTTNAKPADNEISYEAPSDGMVTRILRYMDGIAGDDRFTVQYNETKRNIVESADVLDEDWGEMSAKFRQKTGVSLMNEDALPSSPEDVRAMNGLIANIAAVAGDVPFKEFTINLVRRERPVTFWERGAGNYVVNIPFDIAVRPLKEEITDAALNFQRRGELNDALGRIAVVNGFLSIRIHPECFDNYDEMDTDFIRAVTNIAFPLPPEWRDHFRNEVALTVSDDDSSMSRSRGQLNLNCTLGYDAVRERLEEDLRSIAPVAPPSRSRVGNPPPTREATDRDPKSKQKVELQLRELSRRCGVKINMWDGRRYDYDEVLSKLPTVSRAVRTLVGEDPALKEERVVLSLAGHETGVVQNRRGDRLIEIDYTQDEEVILQTMRDALKVLKARKAVEVKLTDLAKSYNIKDIFLWNNLKYDYDKVDQLMPNIRSAIRRLPSDVFNKIGTGSGVRIVLKGRDEEVGLIQNRSIGKVIAIDAEASEDEIKKVISDATDKLPRVGAVKWTAAVASGPMNAFVDTVISGGSAAINRGINLASSVADSIRGMTGRGVRRVLLAGAVVGLPIAAYKTLPVVERNVDAVASAAADLFSGRSGSSDAPAPPEPVTSGAEAPRPVEGDSPVVPRVQPAPPAPEVTSDMRELMNTKMIMVDGVKLLNNGDIFGAKSKLSEAKRAAEKITDQAQKDLILEKINGFLSKAEAAE